MSALVMVRFDRKRIPVHHRAAFGTAADALTESIFGEARRREHEAVVLSTCERFEVYCTAAASDVAGMMSTLTPLAAPAIEREEEAVRHLFRVAAGLDSRIPGEPHVLGQVREALEHAEHCGTTRGRLGDLFRRALECGRRVRGRVAFGAAAAGYAANAVDRLLRELGTLEQRSILVVGTGVLAADLARALRAAGTAQLTIAGRHEARVRELAHRLSARPVTLAMLHTEPRCFDAVVTAVSAADPIIGVATLATCRAELFIDLGASPNVDPAVREVPGTRVFGLDDLGGHAVMASALAAAGDVVEREVARHRRAEERQRVGRVDVILAAHGAGQGSAANATVVRLAQRLEAAIPRARVTAAFRRGEPTHRAAIQRADHEECVVVPMLTSDGYYAAELRRDVEESARPGPTTVLAPIGAHRSLVDALARRVRHTMRDRRLTSEHARVIVVGHGTRRSTTSRGDTRRVAWELSERTGTAACAAFLDDDPSIEAVVAGVPLEAELIVVPFLLGGGAHATADLPARVLGAAMRAGHDRRRIELLAPVGELPELYDALEQSVRGAVADRPILRAGARGSQLSRRQVDMVAERLDALGVGVDVIEIETRGDLDRTRRIADLETDDPFTREIDEALVAGRVDIAIHSTKDLPLGPDARVVSVAYLPRGSSEDVLVTRTGRGLSSLPLGARIGMSCERRALQVRRLHAGVAPVPIRGDVPTRIAAVDAGAVDAVVLAAAGLERLGLRHRIAERFSIHEIMPAPAQGAIVVQCRADSPHRQLLGRIDDAATRVAVTAELEFARAVTRDGCVAAAHATVANGTIILRVRLLDSATANVWSATLRGRDARGLAIAAAGMFGDLDANAAAVVGPR